MRSLAVLLLTTITAGWAVAQQESIPLFPKIAIETNKGAIVVELDGNRAPITVSNFVTYVRDGHYDGTIFHRVIPGFVAQAGLSLGLAARIQRENPEFGATVATIIVAAVVVNQLINPTFELASGENKAFQFHIFMGPKSMELLDSLGFDMGKALNFGFFNFKCWIFSLLPL